MKRRIKDRRFENVQIYLKIEELQKFLRSKKYNHPELIKKVKELIKSYKEIKVSDQETTIDPNCPDCQGSGVTLYNFWGEITDKDMDTNPDVREEPCEKCYS